jgi:two-component system response regulator MprA
MLIWVRERDRDRRTAARAARGEPESATSDYRPVLVVEDDRAILATVVEILTAEGYPTLPAAGGAEALSVLERVDASLVLLDMRMPGVDGWQVARRIREAGKSVPIVVMTAAEQASRWAKEIRAEGHLAKPFGVEELLAVVRRFSRPPPRRN